MPGQEISGMSEETLLSFEALQTRVAIATRLRSLADAFDGDGAMTLTADDQEVTLTPPPTPEFELEVERERTDAESELSVEAEIEWDESAESTDRAGDDETASTADQPTFEYYVDRAGGWRWRLIDDGTILATGTRNFESEAAVEERIQQVRAAGLDAGTVSTE
jgi:amphi-Trp domain-containing protein